MDSQKNNPPCGKPPGWLPAGHLLPPAGRDWLGAGPDPLADRRDWLGAGPNPLADGRDWLGAGRDPLADRPDRGAAEGGPLPAGDVSRRGMTRAITRGPRPVEGMTRPPEEWRDPPGAGLPHCRLYNRLEMVQRPRNHRQDNPKQMKKSQNQLRDRRPSRRRLRA